MADFYEGDKENMGTNDGVPMRDFAKKRLQNLAKLYAGGEDADISSPIHRTEGNFHLETIDSEEIVKPAGSKQNKSRKGLGGLAALANHINDWEDDLSTSRKDAKTSTPRRSVKMPAPRPPIHADCRSVAEKPRKPQAPQPPSNKIAHTSPSKNYKECIKETMNVVVSPQKSRHEKQTSKELEWQQQVSKEKAKSPANNKKSNDESRKVKAFVAVSSPTKPTPKSPIKSAAFAGKAAIFESSPSRQSKDPALLSVSERKALFEKNKGAAPLPKAPIAHAAPLKSEQSSHVTKTTINDKETKPSARQNSPKVYKNQMSVSPHKESNEQCVSKQASSIAQTVASIFQNKTTICQQQIENGVKQQRQKEMELLRNRFQVNAKMTEDRSLDADSQEEEDQEVPAVIAQKPAQITNKQPLSSPASPPSAGNPKQKRRSGGRRYSDEDSPRIAAVLDDVKRIKVIPPKDGQLYPCLSDIETATETDQQSSSQSTSPDSSYEEDETDTEVNTSFGRDILETVCKNITPQKRPVYEESNETDEDLSDLLKDMDDYLDEAECAVGPTPPKQGRSKSPNSSNKFRTPVKNPSFRKEDSPTYVVEGDNVVPLNYTVSFYRRQQGQAANSPSKQVIRHSIIEEDDESPTRTPSDGVEIKMQQLLDEIMKQQTIISQTSQAINLCYSTPEFVGSTELVEAEQFLLLATRRRLAAQQELENLQVTRSLVSQAHLSGPYDVMDKGNLTISNISLPLKREYARALAATGGKGHHVLCLVKYKERVLCPPLVSTVAGSIKNPTSELNVPGIVKLDNVYSGFAIHVEVYCLQAQEEILPHEVKYHIYKKANSKPTPRKSKQENPLVKPPRESPAGPNAVRSPAFALMGYIIFNVQAINRKQFTLNNTPSMSPLTGIIEMSIKYDVEICVNHRGFLTMFEDVSGFGAWHRRWCYLNGPFLSYWKYPDEEKKKAPIDTIDLRTCITSQVGPVSKDICARLHTMLIETQRSQLSGDKNSLVMICHRDKTIIRHLLSADTKDERNEWCIKLNKALTAIKMSTKRN